MINCRKEQLEKDVQNVKEELEKAKERTNEDKEAENKVYQSWEGIRH